MNPPEPPPDPVEHPANVDMVALRAAAVAALEDPGRWEPYFNVHGDPSVVEVGRGPFGTVAVVAVGPADYGRARAEFIAAADPATIVAVLDLLDAELAR